MKSRRRHELQTNALADALGRLIAWARPRALQIEIGLLAVLAGVLVLVLVPGPWKPSARAETAAWQFAQAAAPGAGPEALRSFLEAHPKAPQAPIATLSLARRLLMRIVRGSEGSAPGTGGPPSGEPLSEAQIEVDLAEARALCEQARDADERHRPAAELLLALITVQEGDLEAGKAMLREVATTWPNSAAAAGARIHLADLTKYEPMAFSSEPLEPPEAEPGDPEGPSAPPMPAGAEPVVPEAVPEAAPVPGLVPEEASQGEETPREEPPSPKSKD